jgi:hypothetical protein
MFITVIICYHPKPTESAYISLFSTINYYSPTQFSSFKLSDKNCVYMTRFSHTYTGGLPPRLDHPSSTWQRLHIKILHMNYVNVKKLIIFNSSQLARAQLAILLAAHGQREKRPERAEISSAPTSPSRSQIQTWHCAYVHGHFYIYFR